MNTIPRTETPALITLMEHWAKTIAKNGGVAAVTIQEGADRLRELETEVERLKKDQIECGNWIGNKMLQPEWDSFKKSLEVINHWKTRAEKAEVEVERLKELLRIESASAQHALAAAERAEAELEEARKDSKRYRYIAWRSDTNPIMIIKLNDNILLHGYDANEAIDAAMKEGAK